MTSVQFIEKWSIPEPNSGCWLWVGSIGSKQPYGSFRKRGKRYYAHRVSYVAYKGQIAHGLEINHICKNKSCVNPDHLEAVTHTENMRWSLVKKVCVRGHDLDSENLYTVTRSNGKVFHRCKKCHYICNRKSCLKPMGR